MCNFATLVAIITALKSDWVSRAMRRTSWHRVGIFESRMFKDLKVFTANVDDFQYIRQITETIADAKTMGAGSHTASVVNGGGDGQSSKGRGSLERPTPSACIPFIGECGINDTGHY